MPGGLLDIELRREKVASQLYIASGVAYGDTCIIHESVCASVMWDMTLAICYGGEERGFWNSEIALEISRTGFTAVSSWHRTKLLLLIYDITHPSFV